MGTNFRFLTDNVARRYTLLATAEETGYEALHLADGNRNTTWRGTDVNPHTVTLDAGLGNTETVDTVVLGGLAQLIAGGWIVDVEWSDDAISSWTSVGSPFPLSPVTISHVAEPTLVDGWFEVSSVAKRAWRLSLSGSPTDVPALAEWALGVRYEVSKNPLYGASIGMARAVQGATFAFSWIPGTEAATIALYTELLRMSPAYPAEMPAETVAGSVHGGRPGWLYDPLGFLLRKEATVTPALMSVLWMNPDATPVMEAPRYWRLGPTTFRQLA